MKRARRASRSSAGTGSGRVVGRGACHRGIGKTPGAVDARLAQEVQQVLELGFGLAREAGDEGRAHDDLRAGLAPALQALEVALAAGRALHAAQHVGVGMLERHVQIGQHAPGGHQRQDVVDLRIGIDIVQAHPGAMRLGQIAELVAQFAQAGLHGLAVPEAGAVLQVDAVGRGVLADDQQFLHPRLEQRTRFVQHITDRARDQVAAHAGDDAEGAAVVAALADLQVGVVPGRELDAGDPAEFGARLGHQVDKGIVRLGHVQMHRVHDLLGRMRPGHGQHLRVHLLHEVATTVAGPGPRQPVTMTLPFAASASPMVSRLSLTASSMKPQVLTMTRSAPA
jgi:hypothetical protein